MDIILLWNNVIDENFAREIMQLFSIGIYELNMDGTKKLSGSNAPILTYSNADIQNFARAWTGFVQQKSRANFEMDIVDENNRIDPMRIIGKNNPMIHIF